MQEFIRLKYLRVTKILSPDIMSARLSLSYCHRLNYDVYLGDIVGLY